MSETLATDTNGDQNAPLPWLASKENLAQTPDQSWKLPGQGDVLLEVSYPYHASDYRRCFVLLNMFRWHFFVLLSLLPGLIAGSFALLLTFLSSNSPPRIALFSIVFIGISIGMFFLLWAVLLCITPLSSWIIAKQRKKPDRLLATVQGVRAITEQTDTTLQWVQIGKPILRNGDVFFVSKSFFGSDGYYVPRTAFRDRDAANRFYAAAVLLWKANGNPDAVSPEAHDEFAPSSPL